MSTLKKKIINSKLKSKKYDDKIVIKPWGQEHVVYRNKNNLSVTLLTIDYNKSTSLHCHTKKKSGFIILYGKAQFQLGLRKKNTETHSSPSKRMIARGLFHSIKSVSKSGLVVLEFETPVDKNDLVRFKDEYGRELKAYEGQKFTRKMDKSDLKFNFIKKNPKKVYKVKDSLISIETHKNFNKLLSNKKNTIFAILDGSICDNYGRNVLSYGDIVKTEDLNILSKVFKIKSTLIVAKVNSSKN